MMTRDFAFRKKTIIGAVALLIVADVTLAAYSWHLSNAPNTPLQQIDLEKRKLKIFRADVEAAEKSEADFPATVKDCDKFEANLPQATSASSTISAELGDISKKAGVQLADIKFHDDQIEGRNITQREMDANITGEYTNVVKFLNGLQKSPNYYVVDSLDLATEASSPNLIRVKVHMRTYFHGAAA
jgi:type IV pilus assembly protein PilO